MLLVASRDPTARDPDLVHQRQIEVRGRAIHLSPPIDWGMDPYNNLLGGSGCIPCSCLDMPLRIYADDADLEALAIARDFRLDWITGNQPGSSRAGDYAWFDMSAGLRTEPSRLSRRLI